MTYKNPLGEMSGQLLNYYAVDQGLGPNPCVDIIIVYQQDI